MNRREVLKTSAATSVLAASGVWAQSTAIRRFPENFLWGVACAGHQVEGNDTASDTWFLGNIEPTVFAEPVGDAVNSFEMWETDLDLAAGMGLKAFRFSVEWSRIEPEPGLYSQAMLDHYTRIVEGCHARGLKPIVTYNHFTSPRWFAMDGGWLGDEASQKFADYCALVTRQMGDGIHNAITFNEPNLPKLLSTLGLPPEAELGRRAMLARAAELTGSEKFVAANVVLDDDLEPLEAAMLAGHADARAAIKAERSDLPVGLSLAVVDEQAAPGGEARRDEIREFLYGPSMRAVRDDDFLGVQNYERRVWSADGALPPPEGSRLNHSGSEVHGPSLAGAVRYSWEQAKVPILVSEHGVGTPDDSIRQWLIPEALGHLHEAIEDGVTVTGYCHWSLLDNFEWIFGYRPTYGLVSVDRSTFERTPKLSSVVYEAIARANAL